MLNCIQNKSKIADHDIHCFKIVLYEKNKYYTGYRHEFITFAKEGFLFTDISISPINNLIYPDVAHIFECIIPKGTEYIKGFYNGKLAPESYGFKAIKFIEKIN